MSEQRPAEFEPLFVKRVVSLYRKAVSTTKFLTQVGVLSSHTDDPEVRASVEDQVTAAGGAFVLRVENPCHEQGPFFYVHGYRSYDEDGSWVDIDFLSVEKINRLNATQDEAIRLIGDQECTVESRALTHDGVCLLMCVAVKFHGLVNYQWFLDDKEMPVETHCVVYVVQPGNYKCQVSGPEGNIFSSVGSFNVQSAKGCGELVVSIKESAKVLSDLTKAEGSTPAHAE